MPGETIDFDALWNHADVAGTEARFREILATAPPDRAYRLELRTQIARCQGLAGRFNEAQATLDAVERELTPALTRVRARYLLERGRVHNSSGQRERARPLFVEAFEIASQDKLDYHAIDAAHMLGITDEPANQMRWNDRALKLAESSQDPRARKWAGPIYNNMGWTHFDAQEYDAALELFRKGVEFRAANKQPRELRIAKYAVARTLRAMGRNNEALATIKPVHDECVAEKSPDGYISEELAECLLAKGRGEEARAPFAEAYELLSKDEWLVEHEPQRLQRLAELSKPRESKKSRG